MRTIFKIKTYSFILGFMITVSAIAQKSSSRPKIGLTLAGGGAKGLAHIGIIQAIDSAGLKVEFVTGTSMGSVVGSLYAAGYSGKQIEQMARSLDWGLLFSSSPRLNAISIEEKSEYDKYALEVPIVKKKIQIGKGIIEGQELWLKLSEYFEPVYNITDFSKLPIPFKCIGTDLETGDAVQMDHGNIVTAVRASMAIPSVFTPVQYDGKLLVDGGVVNNFPVLDVKEMGADYVIGVNLNTGLSKAEELHSALDILLQIGFFKDAATFQKHKDQCDFYIFPDLKGYSTGDFASSDSIIDIGIDAGKLYYPYFKKLADSLDAIYGKTEIIKDRLPKNHGINISSYSIEGLKNTKEKFFFGLLGLKDNVPYFNKETNEAIRRVYGSRYYRIIKFDFLPKADGSTEMHFNVTENPLTAAKLGINYNDFTKLSLKLNLTSRDLLFRESRALVSVAISENPRLYAEYYKFINRNRTARVMLDYYYEAVDFPVYNDFELFQTFRSTYHIMDFQLQKNLNRSSFVGIGQQYIYSKIKTEGAPSLIYNGHNEHWYSYLSYVLNSTNTKYFPTKGWFVRSDAGYAYNQKPKFEYTYNDSAVSSDTLQNNYDDYVRVSINATHYDELSSKFALIESISFGCLFNKNPYVANQFMVGGTYDVVRNQSTFTGLNECAVKTGSIASAKVGLQYKMSKKLFLTARLNAALYDFYGTSFDKLTANKNIITGYGLTLGYLSAIGPMEVTIMNCDQDSNIRTNINLGYIF